MTRKQQAEADQRVVELAREIAVWRATRVSRGRMPAALWERAVTLAGEHGAYATASALKLSAASLYGKLERAKGAVGATAADTRFVELGRVPGPTAAAEQHAPVDQHPLVLEVTGERGQRLLLRVNGKEQLSSVLPLVRECWAQR